MKVEGTDDIYDLTPAPGTVTEEGTFLNAENLLKETTAVLLGGNANMVPDEALVALKKTIDALTAHDVGAPRFAVGSYKGTGEYGSSNPCRLTFDFVPKLLIVAGTVTGYQAGTQVHGATVVYAEGQTGYGFLAQYSSVGFVGGTSSRSDKTVSWYGSAANTTAGPGTQFNISGQTYSYVAFG